MKINTVVHKGLRAASTVVGAFLASSGIATAITITQPPDGTTLGASTTLEICSVPNTSNWRYSGVVSVWNSGGLDTVGFQLDDFVQFQGPSMTGFANMYPEAIQIPQGTMQILVSSTVDAAMTFPYMFDAPAQAGSIQNIALVKITNYTGASGTLTGPEPKASFTGTVQPCAYATGCTLTQGYWKNNPAWPGPFLPTKMFFTSGQTWQEVLDTPVAKGNAYYNLAHQYIAAVLNQAKGAMPPKGVQSVLVAANDYLMTAATTCQASTCSTQITWAKTLDDFNNGVYPGGPPHCP